MKHSQFTPPPKLKTVGYELEVRPFDGAWSKFEGRIIALLASARSEGGPEDGVRMSLFLVQRAYDEAWYRTGNPPALRPRWSNTQPWLRRSSSRSGLAGSEGDA